MFNIVKKHNHSPLRCGYSAITGFTIIELMVSLAIITLLIALLLPAVQSARESARAASCRNNLHQIGLAAQNFESAHGHYPSNGWGFLWIGDPDRGLGPKQPGGWIYQSLPYLDEKTLFELGSGLEGAAKTSALQKMAQIPLAVMTCPSRPGPQSGPSNPDLIFANYSQPQVVAKTDYAVNEGDYISDTDGGPPSYKAAENPAYAWTDVRDVTGVSFLRSRIRVADIPDGTSQTIYAGEKYVSVEGYENNNDAGHDQSMLSGVDLDLNRWTIDTPLPHGKIKAERRFGSAHPGGCHFVFCDGSVRQISYLIDKATYRSMGNRRDGNSNPLP
ncbi:MAG: DUF1559 domain-containing protein [Planctomycetaceae bacterium]|nr:DUF1559 domain-containing protein [Planctomycetaceae bacterium]